MLAENHFAKKPLAELGVPHKKSKALLVIFSVLL